MPYGSSEALAKHIREKHGAEASEMREQFGIKHVGRPLKEDSTQK